MAMAEVRLEFEANVATITLDASDRRNALTPQMAREFVAALEAADAEDQVGAIVIGGGRNFCAGAHRETLSAVGADPAGATEYLAISDIYAAFLRLTATRAPTVAAVRGAVVGAGVNLALAADLRIVATSAQIISGFSRIGLHPGGGHFALLAARAGAETAAASALFGCVIPGRDAPRLGLAWQAVDDSEVDSVALELARRVAEDPELSRQMTATFRQEMQLLGSPWEAAAQIERAPQMWSFRRRTCS
jgi:enoyl-CoA hydratase